jgi:DNA-binding transcriptional regulator LsrR (DeoR family)
MKRATVPLHRPARIDIEQMRLITRAARLHHIQGERQSVIAEKMGISQASVSRFLSLAEEQGIVRTVVVPPEGLYPDLEDGLAQKYNLTSATVVDVNSRETAIASVLGSAAARCLSDELKGGETLGLTSWSVTLREMAKAMEPRANTGVTKVVETLGDLGSPLLQHEAALATMQMAKALNADAVFLRTPGVMVNKQAVTLATSDSHIKNALALLDRLDIALIGIGPADFHGPLEAGDNFFTAKQLADVRAAGAIGQLHQRFIDVMGQPVATELDDLVVGISLPQLRNARRKIAVAGGTTKHQAIAAALRGRWIDVLVTDVNTANFLMANPAKGKS